MQQICLNFCNTPVFMCVQTIINLYFRSISTTSSNVNNSILLLDTPGFQNPATCGRLAGATFEEMCHNYVQASFGFVLFCFVLFCLHNTPSNVSGEIGWLLPQCLQIGRVARHAENSNKNQ